jgi:cytochrome c peroxidase
MMNEKVLHYPFYAGYHPDFSQSAFKDPEPLTAVTLGRKLFFDPILSRTKKISCASCHKEEFAFSDTSAISLGVHSRKGVRNTPSAMNMSLQVAFFWDGRATTLEQQALIPLPKSYRNGFALSHSRMATAKQCLLQNNFC